VIYGSGSRRLILSNESPLQSTTGSDIHCRTNQMYLYFKEKQMIVVKLNVLNLSMSFKAFLITIFKGKD
jgi:hypothetical protein